MMKKLNALGLCRVLRSHLEYMSGHREVLQDKPLWPTHDLTLAQILDGVIAGNGTLHFNELSADSTKTEETVLRKPK